MNNIHLALVLAYLCAGHAGAAGVVGNAKAGEAAFKKCASCHQVGRFAQAGYGPQLNGIIGRNAAATSDFKYSAAMKKSGIVWTEQKLGGISARAARCGAGNQHAVLGYQGRSADRRSDHLPAHDALIAAAGKHATRLPRRCRFRSARRA
jgi:cytochrome c2